ncbi:unnamed protein product [Anisakis simplex]|uniref:Acetylcholine receptor subunit alpha-type acr-16 n=1 Tax=Anisakis simplex TaxID=6269 RepID=A0A0M3J1B0_ANISI|nr:unnamed protein product [Anisakis simplex]
MISISAVIISTTVILMKVILLAELTVASEGEARLYRDLLQNYSVLERPVESAAERLLVRMRIYLQQIRDVDERNQNVAIYVWLRFIWHDYRLRWNPQLYGGVADVRFPFDGADVQLWRPDILLYNSVDESFDATYKSNFLVYSSGEVNWIPPGVLKFSCPIDITWFPFDEQLCQLKFGSWTFHGDTGEDGDDSVFVRHQMDLSEYLRNGEWDLLATPAEHVVTYYSCCPEPYPTLHFQMHLRRRALYYGLNMIIPSLLVTLMTALGFLLPPDSGEKVTLELSILLSVCFFLSLVADQTPPTSEAIPLLGVFFLCCMMVVSASVIFTVIVLNLHSRSSETHSMSPFFRRILLNWLPWFLMMRRPGQIFHRGYAFPAGTSRRLASIIRKQRLLPTESPPPFASTSASLPKASSYSNRSERIWKSAELLDGVDMNFENDQCERESNDNNDTSAWDAQILILHRICEQLGEICTNMQNEDAKERDENDWQYAAMVVDRACLICFSLFIMISTSVIAIRAPYSTFT